MSSVLEIRDLSLDVPTDDGPRPILRGISLRVGAGEAVGVVGESGSGKSMTLKCVARLTPPGARVSGDVLVGGREVRGLKRGELRKLRRNELGYVFQDPRSAINTVHTVGDFLVEVARDSGQDVGTARKAAAEILVRMGIKDPERRMAQYPFELSGGLLQRVMIASVLLARPAILLADEPTTALDVTTQSDVLALTDELRREQGTAMVFVTHDLDLAMAVCQRIVVVYAGRVLETATVDTLGTGAGVRGGPLHPYTRGLLASRPPLDRRLETIPVIPGSPVSAADAGTGCPFVARCPVRLPVCEHTVPAVTSHEGGEVRCHRAEEIAAGLLDDLLPIGRPPLGRPPVGRSAVAGSHAGEGE